MTPTRSTLYTNGAIFTAARRPWAEAMLIAGDRISYVGDRATARRIAGGHAEEVDLDGALVLPGIVEGHAHLNQTGQSLRQLDLLTARDLGDIQQRLRHWAAEHPGAPRLEAFGWQHGTIPGGHPTKGMLDHAVADKPVYVQSRDYHSIWVNTAALAELGIDSATPNPPGGTVYRNFSSGEATGYIDEAAVQRYVWPKMAEIETDADRDAQIAATLASYRSHGITSTTEMGLRQADLATMVRAEAAGALTARIVAFWVLQRETDPAANLAQVTHVIELASKHRSPWLRVAGIKCVIDGTIGGCTAAVSKPYANGSIATPMWDVEALAPVVTAADAAGLQVAMHAIGDQAVRIAIESLEQAIRHNGVRPRRHRIEHLQVVDPQDINRLAALGVTASMQPVHSDPAIVADWRAMLGDERIERAHPWTEMTDAGAALAFGTDSPTAPFQPMRNIFIAATRRSAFDPSLEPNLPRYAVPLADAVRHVTAGPAWACGAEESVGQLKAGLHADFVVLDRNIFDRPLEELLVTRVRQTVTGGRSVFES